MRSISLRAPSPWLVRRASLRALLPLIALLAALAGACGDEGNDSGGAAGAGPLPTIGMPCTKDCVTGFVCERAGFFAGQCTAGCSSGAACQLLAGGTACFGAASMQCGLTCTTTDQCPMGTACLSIEGQMGCRIPPAQP